MDWGSRCPQRPVLHAKRVVLCQAGSIIAMEWEEVDDGRDGPEHHILLQRREERVLGRGELQADDCVFDNEDRVDCRPARATM